MPFDSTLYEERNPALNKMDRVIDLLSEESRWCKRQLRSPDGRYCIMGAIQVQDAVAELKSPILLAIEQVTGHIWPIEDFNDHSTTTHALVVRVLRQARENIILGTPHPLHHPLHPRIGAWALFRRIFEKQRELA
jgi:hypothetical protein